MYLSHSELRQLDLLNKKSPLERFLLMVQLINDQIEAMKAGIKYKKPNIDNEALYKCLRARMQEIYSWKR